MNPDLDNEALAEGWEKLYLKASAERDEAMRLWFEDADPLETPFAARYRAHQARDA